LRRGVSGILAGDEEASAQRLISTVPSDLRAEYLLPDRFDARAADSRLALLGMASLNPRDLITGAPVDVPALVEASGVDAFRRILPTKAKFGKSPANRLLLSGHGAARREVLERAAMDSSYSPVLRSHGIGPEATVFLLEGREEEFIGHRQSEVETAVRLLGVRLAAWTRTDRPSIAYILEHASEVPK
jgi:hypothetical protein